VLALGDHRKRKLARGLVTKRLIYRRNVSNPLRAAQHAGRNARVGQVRYETAVAKQAAAPLLRRVAAAHVVAYPDRVNVSRRRRTEPAPPNRTKRNAPVLE
jgi:hypothetical protein